MVLESLTHYWVTGAVNGQRARRLMRSKAFVQAPARRPEASLPTSAPRSDICQYLRRTCCGQPNVCSLDGAEVDRGVCEKCDPAKKLEMLNGDSNMDG